MKLKPEDAITLAVFVVVVVFVLHVGYTILDTLNKSDIQSYYNTIAKCAMNKMGPGAFPVEKLGSAINNCTMEISWH